MSDENTYYHPAAQRSSTEKQATKAFLGVYELLLEVFTHADRKTVAVAARSSKALRDPALDVLWRVVPRASFLFSILCPLEGAPSYDGYGTRRFDFERDLYPEDWDRFLPYSRRVEELSCLDDASVPVDQWNEPSHKAFAKVAASRPPQLSLCDVFPRLRRLSWSVYSHKVLRSLPLFLVPTLSFLEVKIDNIVEQGPMVAFIKQLAARCGPSMKDLRFNTDFSLSSLEKEVVTLFKSMPNLERLTVPRFWITKEVFAVLATLPHLQFIGQRKAYWWGNAEDIESGLVSAIEALPAEAWTSLKDITYDTRGLDEARRFLSHKFAPKNLLALCVTSIGLEEPRHLQAFLSCLAIHNPQLQELDIGLTFPITDAPGHSTDITVTTLRPLHMLPDLTHFGLATHFPLKLSDADLDTFTSGLDRLKVLWLNETPAQAVQLDAKSDLTLASLRIIARNCPQMEELSLFVDATTVPDDLLPSSSGTRTTNGLMDLTAIQAQLSAEQVRGPPTLKNLRYLNLGVSHIGAPSTVANYVTECLESWDTPDPSEPSAPSPLSSPLPPSSTQSRQPLPIHRVTRSPKPKPFYFDWTPRFWPAPPVASEMEGALLRRREGWEHVAKIIPALMEQKVRMEVMRREMMGLINGLVAMKAGGTVL